MNILRGERDWGFEHIQSIRVALPLVTTEGFSPIDCSKDFEACPPKSSLNTFRICLRLVKYEFLSPRWMNNCSAIHRSLQTKVICYVTGSKRNTSCRYPSTRVIMSILIDTKPSMTCLHTKFTGHSRVTVREEQPWVPSQCCLEGGACHHLSRFLVGTCCSSWPLEIEPSPSLVI